MPSALRFESKRPKSRESNGVKGSLGQTVVTRPADPEDNRIFVRPAWAVEAKPRRRGIGWLWSLVVESRFVEALRIEVKVILSVLVIGALIFLSLAGAKSFYRTKSEAGVDLSPIHGPDIAPFIR